MLMIIGHFAVAGIGKRIWFKEQSLVFLTLAALGPDIFDKPAKIFFGMPGRGMSHSLLFFVILIAVSWILVKALKQDFRLVAAGTVMWGSHLLGDFLEFQILLWPFLGSLDPGPKFNLLEKLRFFYIDCRYPEQFWAEILCVTVGSLIIVSDKLPRLFSRECHAPRSSPTGRDSDDA